MCVKPNIYIYILYDVYILYYVYIDSVLNDILYGLLHVDSCVLMVCSGGIVHFVT